MKNEYRSKEIIAATADLLTLGTAVGVIALLKKLELGYDTFMAVVILLLPILVYVIVSGRLKELRAPGGWHAKFAETTKQ